MKGNSNNIITSKKSQPTETLDPASQKAPISPLRRRGQHYRSDAFSQFNQLQGNQLNQRRLGLARIFPDKNVLAKVFWCIIQDCPLTGVLPMALAIGIEEIGQAVITALIMMQVNDDQMVLIGGNGSNLASIVLIVTGTLIGVIILNLLALWYVYRQLLKSSTKGDTELEAFCQILCKIQSIFYTLFGTFLHEAFILFEVWTFFLLAAGTSSTSNSSLNLEGVSNGGSNQTSSSGNSNIQQTTTVSIGYTSQQTIAQLVLSSILVMLTFVMIMMHDSFFNLNFINPVLINSRPKGSRIAFLKPIFYALTCALSLKPNISRLEAGLYLGIISGLSLLQLLQSVMQREYFNYQLNHLSIHLRSLKTSLLLSFMFTVAFQFTAKEFIVEVVIILPVISGLTMMLRQQIEGKVYKFISELQNATASSSAGNSNSGGKEGGNGGLSRRASKGSTFGNSMQDVKDCQKLEWALYLVFEYLSSEDYMVNTKFQGLMVSHEGRGMDTTQSYYHAINTLLLYTAQEGNQYDDQGKLIGAYGGSDTMPGALGAGGNSDEDTLKVYGSLNEQDHLNLFSSNIGDLTSTGFRITDSNISQLHPSQRRVLSGKFTNLSAIQSPSMTGQQLSVLQQQHQQHQEMLQGIASTHQPPATFGGQAAVSAAANAFIGGGGLIEDQTKKAEGLNQRLDDVFQSEAGARKGQQQMAAMQDMCKNVIKVNGMQLDSNNIPLAINTVKLKFFYEVLIKQAIALFPDNLSFMFFKTYVAMDIFRNKYLALTTITHINSLAQKLSYREQVQSLISVNYFLKTILTSSSSSSSNPSSFSQSAASSTGNSSSLGNFNSGSGANGANSFSGGQQSGQSELDSELLLDQALKVEEVINCIKNCTLKIILFWQLAVSESITNDQISRLQELTTEISELLKSIRVYVKQLESIDGFQSSCLTLCQNLQRFLVFVIRDKNVGSQIARQMSQITNNFGGGRGSKMLKKRSLVDEIGVVVVDGNFSLYGKVLFSNKIINQMLGYQNGDLYGKLIHSLMPTSVAEVHNIYWNNFAQIGEAKVLDQVRYLYVKDSQGFVTPFKIFIKFQFSPKYGFSFVGMFRKPKGVAFETDEGSGESGGEKMVQLGDTCQLICNHQGKVLEISQKFQDLANMTPQTLDMLHNSLAENLQISHFVDGFYFNQLDFSKYSCLQFKSVTLKLGNLATLSKNLEIVDLTNKNEEVYNPFDHLIDTRFNCRMKVIKETYGTSTSAQLSLYYVLFYINEQMGSETTNNMNTSVAIQRVRYTKNSDESHFGNVSENSRDMQNLSGEEKQSHSMYDQYSMSSASSSNNNSPSDTDIKYVEEGIDYDKTPKPLLYLKLSTAFLFISLIVLASVQFGQSQSFEAGNRDCQQSLIKTVTNQQLFHQLLLMSRTYSNVNLGLEPQETEYFKERRGLLRELALEYIEEIRENFKDLQTFFKSEELIDLGEGGSNDMQEHHDSKDVELYSIRRNGILEKTKQSKFYALNTWLVSIYEVFIYEQFNSTLGTFLWNATSGITPFDQALFYVMINGQSHLEQQFKILSDAAQNLIHQQVQYSLNMNKYYVAITSILVVLLIAGSLYSMTIVIRFKSRVLIFFTEMNLDTMSLCEHSSRIFYDELVTNNMEYNDSDILMMQEEQDDQFNRVAGGNQSLGRDNQAPLIKVSKVEHALLNSSGTSKLLGAPSPQTKVPMLLTAKQASGRDLLSQKGNNKLMRKESARGTSGAKSGDNSSSSSSSDSEESKSGEVDKSTEKRTRKHHTKRRKERVSSKQLQSLDGKSVSMQRVKNNDRFNNNNFDPSGNGLGAMENEKNSHIKNKEVARKLNEYMKKTITNLAILAIVTSVFFIAYFLVQYFLFTQAETKIMDNSNNMRDLFESLECVDTFLFDVRQMQASNYTSYELSTTAIGNKLKVQNRLETADRLNQTYQTCIKKNQFATQWSNVNDLSFQSQDTGKGVGNTTLCSYLDKNRTLLNSSNCENIYQGVLTKSILQSVSVILQDALYISIRFTAPQNSNLRTAQGLRQQISQSNILDLVDAHTFYQSVGLRNYYNYIVNHITTSQSQQIITVLFIMFISILALMCAVLIFFLMNRIRVQFWHSFNILRLVPKDSVDPEFIKRINEYLNKA